MKLCFPFSPLLPVSLDLFFTISSRNYENAIHFYGSQHQYSKAMSLTCLKFEAQQSWCGLKLFTTMELKLRNLFYSLLSTQVPWLWVPWVLIINLVICKYLWLNLFNLFNFHFFSFILVFFFFIYFGFFFHIFFLWVTEVVLWLWSFVLLNFVDLFLHTHLGILHHLHLLF